MIRFIWKNWWRRKTKLFILLIGVLIISSGLSYLLGISNMNKQQVENELQKRWRTSYDIVVRPDGTRSTPEKDGLLDPNFLSGIAGGISLEQYEQIKAINDIEVAAPISMIGYVLYSINLEQLQLDEGIYRMVKEEVSNNGVHEHVISETSYHPSGNKEIMMDKFRENPEYFIGFPYEHVTAYRTVLLAAIDPEQEAKLVGLDQAIIPQGEGRYFSQDDYSENILLSDESVEPKVFLSTFPIILSNHSYTDQQVNYIFEKLDLPFEQDQASETLQMVEEKGGEKYLNTLKGTVVKKFSFSDKQIHSALINSIAGYNVETGEPNTSNHLERLENRLFSQPQVIRYQERLSPFPERWPNAYEVKTFPIEGTSLHTFRVNSDENRKYVSENIRPYWIGFYDPSKLAIQKDPNNELPLETYRPAEAALVLDKENRPVNPQKMLQPTNINDSFISTPPSMLTTLEAAEMLLGDKPISAIRVKVLGVDKMSEANQQKLEKIAAEIEEKTGLITDITLGTSPQDTLIHVPAINNEEALGWIQQPWIKIGSSIALLQETQVGFGGLVISVIIVALLYVSATSLVSLLARRKEFAVLLAIGWRPKQISKLLLMESMLLGFLAMLISWAILSYIHIVNKQNIHFFEVLIVGFIAFIIYFIGAIVPAILVRNISPHETMRKGEISKLGRRFVRTRSVISMAFNHFLGKWRRGLLSVITIALPTSLLAIFLYITFRMQGVMFTTRLGQYVALEVGPVHYTAIGVALVMAILTTAQILWQNIVEREQEISLLKALGWKNSSVRSLIWTEGMITGIFSAAVSVTISYVILQSGVFGEIPMEEMRYVFATGIIPIIISLLGTILPGEKAVKIAPIAGLNGLSFVKTINTKSEGL
ncbi:ABC transporter permease [Bacillus kwashiorkori]|uniref:ABC transporter permease n=1 Tax=Bacillus kwashiorkori TaxID=1522318 RepID=UPI0007813A82|nr:FtsX-like permease family protein [Bacillus kwashiorkori]